MQLKEISYLKKEIEQILKDNKAKEIISVDLKNKTSLADFMIVASGNSSRHIQALSEIVLDRIFNNGKERVTPEMYAEMNKSDYVEATKMSLAELTDHYIDTQIKEVSAKQAFRNNFIGFTRNSSIASMRIDRIRTYDKQETSMEEIKDVVLNQLIFVIPVRNLLFYLPYFSFMFSKNESNFITTYTSDLFLFIINIGSLSSQLSSHCFKEPHKLSLSVFLHSKL